MTFESTSDPVPDLPTDRLPPVNDLPSDPAAPSFGVQAADDLATDDAAAPIGALNPAQVPAAFTPPPPPDDGADSGLPLSPADAARDNARGGHWAMSEWYDGWVYLGADGRPVVRNDGSRIGFRFADAPRLTQQLAAAPAEETADGSDRRALAPLDSRFNKDWDPQRPKSTLADMTKWTRLLAYHLVQTTEPEEAVRRAVSMIFGNPVTLDARGEKLWVPTGYDAETVKSLAGTLLRQAVGPELVRGDGLDLDAAFGASSASDPLPTTRTIRGVPLDGRGLGSGLLHRTSGPETASNSGKEAADNRQQPATSEELPKNIKDMDRLTFRDALEHYAKGKGQPIRIPLSSLDLSNISTSQFDATGNAKIKLQGEDGLTIGTIELELIGPETVRAKAGYDDYDFDIKFEEETRWRDVATALGYIVNEGYAFGRNTRIETGPLGLPIPVTEGGRPYKIFLQGSAKIKR